MTNRLIERLHATYQGLSQQYDDITNRCADEGRDPNSAEQAELIKLREELEPLGQRVIELREDEDRRQAARSAFENFPGADYVMPAAGTPAATRAQLPPLVMGEEQLRSLMAAVEAGEPWSQRLDTRAILTPVGAVIGTWDPSVGSGREDRLAQDLANRPADGNTVQYLAVTNPAKAAAVAEGALKPDSGAVVGRRSGAVAKWACFSDVSSELLADFGDANVLMNNELMGALVTAENQAVVEGVITDPGILAPAPTSTSRLIAVLEVIAAVRNGPAVRQADLVVISPLDLPSLWGELDSVGSLMAGAGVLQVSPEGLMLWGCRLRQTIAMEEGKVLVGRGADATFWAREGANVRSDPFSQSDRNLVRLIAEERGFTGPTTPSAWAYSDLPAAGFLGGGTTGAASGTARATGGTGLRSKS